jgi:hypothetical protein
LSVVLVTAEERRVRPTNGILKAGGIDHTTARVGTPISAAVVRKR